MPVIPSTATLNNIFKNFGPWTTIRTLSNSDPDSDNVAPPDNQFVSVNLVGDDNVQRLEIFLKDIICSNAPTAIVVGIWVKIGSDAPYLLGSYGATTGENRANISAPFGSLSPILMELQQKGDIKVACKIIIDPTRLTYTLNPDLLQSSTNQGLGANTGFNNTLCITDSSSSGSPLGISGVITNYNPSTSAITVSGANFLVDEPLRLPWGNMPNLHFPPLGLSGKIVCADINLENSTINITGSSIDFRLFANRFVRLRLSSIASNISVFPSLDNTVAANSVTYYLINVTGSPGNQTAQLSNNGVVPLTITARGAGWIYIFPFKAIEGLKINASSRLLLNGNLVSFQNDWSNQPVAVTTAGTASVVTQTNHNFLLNDAIRLSGTTVPTGANTNDIFYVIPIDNNSYKLSLLPSGLPVVFTGAGTAVTAQKIGTNTISAVTISVGTASIIHFGSSATTTTAHWMGAFQEFTLGGTTRPGAAYTYNTLYIGATALAANSFQAIQRRSGAAIAFETAGSNVTLSSMLQFGQMMIEKATILAGDASDTDSSITFKNIDNSPLSMSSPALAVCTISPSNSPKISGTILVRAIGGV